jgi:phosphoribosylamine--glycine ligase
MLTSEGPKVIEFNARFGDPETQSYMRHMDGDLVPALLACAHGDLSGISLSFKEGASACIVMASGGYPNAYESEKEISIVKDEEGDGIVVFHASTKRGARGELLSNGGRVLNVTARGATLGEALKKAYEGVHRISFPGAVYRNDIGQSVLS